MRVLLLIVCAYVSGSILGFCHGNHDDIHTVLRILGIALGMPIGWLAAGLRSDP